MRIFIYLFCFLVFLFSCKKYERDNGFSTYSVKSRLAYGVWNCVQIKNLNNSISEDIPQFSCLLNFDKEGKFESTKTTSSGVLLTENNEYQFKSNKNLIELNGSEFQILSLSWNSFIILSSNTNKEYYFEKWISVDTNFRENEFYSFPIIE